MSQVRVRRLGHAAFEATDLDALVAYYRDVMGFAVTEQDADAVVLSGGVEHQTVALHRGAEDRLLHVAHELAPSVSLDDAERALRDAGVEVSRRSDAEPGIAELLELQDLEGNTLQLYSEVAPSEQGYGEGGIRPTKLGHVCLRAHDVPALSRWYEEVLGFRWSDWIGDFFVFLRCGPEHHTMNLLKGERAGNVLHHIAYELRDFADVQPAVDTLMRHGYPLDWGPGRHGPGHNVFTYHRGAGGHVVELFTQLDVMLDEERGEFDPRPWHEDRPQRPKVWGPGPLVPNRWGPPPPDWFLH